MSERGDQLRAQADAVDAEDMLAENKDAALEAYRANMNDETKAAYRNAVESLAALRQLARFDRPARLTVIADSVRYDEEV